MEFEKLPGSKGEKEVNPLLKLALELGPLIVFFFANSRGKALSETIPVLQSLGGPIFIATAAFMVATAVALVASKILTGKLPIMPMVVGRSGLRVRSADAVAAG